MEYNDFLKTKQIRFQNKGIKIGINDLNTNLFDWQKKLVQWALFKGRSALFEACGLGKTIQQLGWAKTICDKTDGDVLIFAPLAVSLQTKEEGQRFGIDINIAKDNDSVLPGINITNYEKMENFDLSLFTGIVLDESSILKSFTGKTTAYLIKACREIKYKLCCTATPAPNDFMELGNTAEFLGVMTRPEMLSMFFINDASNTGTWRLKGHTKKNKFWEWLSSWAMVIQKPADIGYDNKGFDLPELRVHKHVLQFNGKKITLFAEEARTLSERREARKESLDDRLNKTIQTIDKKQDNRWLIWCNLNIESQMLKSAINNSVEIKGADSLEYKEKSVINFAEGKINKLITKSKICGFGLNWQICHDIIFFGLSDSFESYYQSIRRCWRFGQKYPVNVHVIIGERESAVLRNIERKEKDTQLMFDSMVGYMHQNMVDELSGLNNSSILYNPGIKMRLPHFLKG